MNENGLAFASIQEIARLFRKRKLSPVELTKMMLERIERMSPALNAYITIAAELALAQAKKAESELFAPRSRRGHRERGPLHGIPISLKDNIYTKGVRTTAGSKILRDFVPDYDARIVTLLKEAGAVILGKTNMHEFAYGVTTNNPHYGPTRNPWDVARIPGGSSGGSAAAVAAGICYGSFGTDAGGSIRIPAALCGVVGLKPTHGSVSSEGIVPLSPSLDCTGPLARTSTDAAILLDAVYRGKVTRPSTRFAAKSQRRSGKFRLGLPKQFFFDVLSDEVRAVFARATQAFEKLGARIIEISIPHVEESEDAGNQIAWAEATHYHEQAGYFPARAPEYSEDVRKRLEIGTKVSATSYLRALDTQRAFSTAIQHAILYAKVDALLVPTVPIAAPLIGEEKIRIGETEHSVRALLLRLNRPANLAGTPAISIPGNQTPSGLPVGLQLMSTAMNEGRLLQIAGAYERFNSWHERRPPQ